MTVQTSHLTGGEKRMMRSINPYTEELMGEYALMTKAELDRAVRTSRTAFRSWRGVPVEERATYVKRMGDHLREEKHKYAELITREMGKPIREALAEIEKCAWLCDYYGSHAALFLAAEEIETEAKRSYVTFEPLGVVLAIMPWNFPFWQVFRFGIPAISAGNCVLLKHAPSVPATALAIEAAFTAAAFPQGVFRTVLIDPPDALALLDEDMVDAVTLTGSVKAGAHVGETAGRKIKKVVLELGGSDPFIVLDDADIEKAARTAVAARLINTGQSCIAAKRFIVLSQVADAFQKLFVARLEELKIGDPMDHTTDLGPLARKDILDNLNEQLRDARAKGAEILQHDHSFPKGFFFAPAVVLHPKETMKVLKEEVFGPIAPIIVVDSEDEAIRIANATEYGLGASIWSRDLTRAQRVAGRIEAGFVAINDMVRSDPRLPFGGVKRSGVGRELSHWGLREFVNIKTVVVKE
ncbi:MAG: Succinate-semialdehyde dehydrogenase [Deltaproteobacteria bacterium]|nr:Succinate-semialdehyde dehydrogenase [Deltaproteobacteria bacterium]